MMRRLFILLSMALVVVSCSTTKHIPDDDYLFTGLTKIAYDDKEDGEHAEATMEELEAALATKPNGALFGSPYYRTPFPYGLWIWNATTGSNSHLAKWLNRSFGKTPVLMSQVNPALRASVARQVLRSNGYLHGDVSYSEVPQKNPKKMKLGYQVHMDSLFRVDTMSYERFPKAMQALIDSTRDEALIAAGSPFSVANLDAERTRLSQLFRNNGYYYYQPAYASYLADTFDVANRAKLRLQMADSLPPQALRPWYVGKRTIVLKRQMMEPATDTLERRRMRVLYNGKRPPLRPGLIMKDLKLRQGQLFSYADYNESVQKINATGVFQNVELQFTPRSEGPGHDSLDVQLTCILDKPYDFYIETSVKNRTIGRFGPELKIGLTRRNAFHGAEKIDLNLHGAYEWESGNRGGNTNSYQYGADASIEFPRILLPWRRGNNPQPPAADGNRPRFRMRRFFGPQSTTLKISTDIINRPKYYKMHVVSGEWTYRWQPSENSRHEFSPLMVKYQFMNSHTLQFDSLLLTNPYLTMSMSDYFIPKMRYVYTYASPSTQRNPIRWETSIEEAGNLTALYDVVIQGNGWRQRDKTLFKNPYSQFFKIETDFTKTWTLSQRTQLVGHLNYGLLWSYGNSTGAPFSEAFYVGGANSIRAFAVRSIGPGSFGGFINNPQFSYMMQNGDTKLVMNLELRHRLFGNLYGAVFLDAGNVWNSEDWTLNPEEDDDETTRTFLEQWNSLFKGNSFRFSKFLDEIATGTGIGLRYDLDFLVLRLDWGFGLHLPYDTGRSGYFNISRFKDMHTLHLAIGYPF